MFRKRLRLVLDRLQENLHHLQGQWKNPLERSALARSSFGGGKDNTSRCPPSARSGEGKRSTQSRIGKPRALRGAAHLHNHHIVVLYRKQPGGISMAKQAPIFHTCGFCSGSGKRRFFFWHFSCSECCGSGKIEWNGFDEENIIAPPRDEATLTVVHTKPPDKPPAS